jgi:predicted transcriptional regulator
MTKKRDRLEVIHDILRVIKDNDNSIRPTPLLRYSNLSSQRFPDYITELQEKEFIREERDKKGRKYYTLTDKGFQYLKRYKTIIEFIDDFNL